jgi:Ser/Thr protein kinase RdoA (MazF antagonist)
MTDSVDDLVQILERCYATKVHAIRPLTPGGKSIYQIQHIGQPDWVVRVYPTNGQTDGPAVDAGAQAALLLHLAAHRYPAERVITTTTGEPVAVLEHGRLLVTTYLGPSLHAWRPGVSQATSPTAADGQQSVATFGALGALLAQLHSLPLPTHPLIGQAGMLPLRELTWVAGELAAVSEQVPAAWQSEYNQLVAAVQHTSRCEDAPITLIHNDCNLGNVVALPNGGFGLVDWEMAGRGPAVLDVGILLRNCFSKQSLSIDHAAIRAVVNGYCQYRQLSTTEQARLPDAIQFMTLVLLAAYFPERMIGAVQEDELLYGATYAAWQAQYAAGPAIAEFAQAEFTLWRLEAAREWGLVTGD